MIQAAGPAHAAALGLIHAASFPPAERWDAVAIGTQLTLPGTFGLLHPDGGFVLARVAADEAEVLTLAVAPSLRRRGAGRLLLEQGMRRAAALGAAAMFLEVAASNLPARALYERLGFRQVGQRRRYYASGDDALVLRAVLSLCAGTGRSCHPGGPPP